MQKSHKIAEITQNPKMRCFPAKNAMFEIIKFNIKKELTMSTQQRIKFI